MKQYIKHIFLVWRRGRKERRIKVGLIKRNQTEGVTFRYLAEGVKEAQKHGFSQYPDFPDLNAIYKNNVLEIFAQRLTNTERSDIQKYYDYWEIKPEFKDNKYYVLAQTQGMLSTDNFEFIAEYNPIKDLNFISEICGLTDKELPPDTFSVGDELTWQLEKRNSYDPYAVQLFKDNKLIGYVKTIHSRVFHDSKYKQFRIVVRSVEKNGHINRAFIAIYTK